MAEDGKSRDELLRELQEARTLLAKQKAREERLRQVYADFPTPGYTWKRVGDDFELVSFNHAAVEATDGKAENYLGVKLTEFIPDMPEMIREMHSCFSEQHSFQRKAEYTFRTTGETKTVLNTYMYFPPDRVVVLQDDITDRIEAERALRESEESARLQFQRFPMPTYTWKLQGRDFVLAEHNLAAEAATQGKIKEFLGIQLSEMYKDNSEIREDLHLCFEEQTSFKKEIDYYYQSIGTLRRIIVHYTYVPLDKVVVSTEDITDRVHAEAALRESEEMFRAVTESAADAIFCKDLDRRYTLANPAMAKLLGRPASEIIGKRAEDLFDPEAVAAVQEADDPAFEGRVNVGSWAINVGEDRYTFHVVEVPLLDSNGDVRGICGIVRDISDLKNAEKAIRENEEKYRTLIANIPDVTWTTDAEGNTIFISPDVERVYGFSTEEVVANGFEVWLGRIHPDDKEKVEAAFGELMESDHYDVEYRIQRKDGAWIWLHDRSIKTYEKDGRRLADGVFSDVTDRHAAEQALRDSEGKFRSMGTAALDAVILMDSEGTAAFWNPAAERMFGYSEQEMLGKSIHEVLVPTKYLERFRKGFEQFKNSGKGFAVGKVLELTAIHKDGTEFPIEIAVAPILIQDSRWAAATIRDISDRRKTEQELLTRNYAINSSLNAIAIAGLDGVLVFVNPAFLRMWGLESDDDAIGKSSVDFWREKKQAREVVGAVKDSGSFFGEMQGLRKDGSAFDAQVSASVIISALGAAVGMVASFVDLTQQKRTEKEKRALEERLYQAGKMEAVGTLAGGIAHDINNILQSIFTNVSVGTLELSGDHPVQETLQSILRSSKRAADLVDQILTFSRQSHLTRVPVFLAPLVKETLKMLDATKPPNVRMNVVASDPGAAVLADPSQVHQLYMNICKNAFFAMQNNGGLLEIETRRVDVDESGSIPKRDLDAGSYVQLTFEDSGDGMEPEVLGKIFDPFFTTKPVGEGTGLGLSVVHGIVETLEGRIFASSEPGKGTKIEIFLPRLDKSSMASAADEGQVQKGNENILCVDDEEEQVRLTQVVLAKSGYSAEATTSAEDALTLLEDSSRTFDLAIFDQMMPEMTGVELAEEFLQRGAKTKVVIATGNPSMLPPEQDRPANICCILIKPFTVESLTRTIRDLLDGKAD
jgi:PAS domain S-box-containing protein